jgi:hypothetical protein
MALRRPQRQPRTAPPSINRIRGALARASDLELREFCEKACRESRRVIALQQAIDGEIRRRFWPDKAA